MRHRLMTHAACVAVGVAVGGAAVWFLRQPVATPTPATATAETKLPDRWRPAEAEPPGPYPREVRLSADGKRLVVGWSFGVRAWDLESGQSVALHADAVPTGRGAGAALSPDGRWVIGYRGANPNWQLVTWNAATGEEVRAAPTITEKPGTLWRPTVLGFDRDGFAWVVGADGAVERVEVPSGRVTRSIELPVTAGGWQRLIVSPDGRWLALGGGTAFALRATGENEQWAVVERHPEPTDRECLPQPTRCPTPCGFSPDGRRLVTYDRVGHELAVWETGAKPAKVASRVDELTPWTHLDDLAFAPDGGWFAFVFTPQKREGNELRVCDAATLNEVARRAPPGGLEGFAFTPDGAKVVMAHPNGTLSTRAVSREVRRRVLGSPLAA